MKYIKTVPEIELADLQGRKFVDENKNQLKMDLKSFLVNLLSDSKFAEDKLGSSKLFFIVEIKNQIDKQDFNKEYIELENEQYKAIKQITENPSTEYDSRLAYSLLPFIKTILEASDEKP